jgi:bacillithiol biosynthesis deacetylase BshB1
MDNMDPALDLLAFAAHPDDAEIGCGGTLALLGRRGYRVGIVDLTRGELASRGTVDARRVEADHAARVLGLLARENLELPDGGLRCDPAQVAAVVDCLRRRRPGLVLAPNAAARHPDHRHACELIEHACFVAALRNFAPQQPPHQVRRLLFYGERFAFRPAFVVDVTEAYELKLEAVRCYRSQLHDPSRPEQAATLIGAAETLELLEARDRGCGALAGVTYAEAFSLRECLLVADPVQFFSAARPAHAFPSRPDQP